MRHRINVVAGITCLGLIASGAAFAAPEATTTVAATTDCLAKPKQETPAGGHWYFRTDRTTKRKCWFVGDASAKSTTATATKPSRAAAPTPEKIVKDVPPSVSNARAELQNPTAASDDEKLQESIWPPLPDNAADDASDTDAPTGTASPFLRTAQLAPPQDAASRQPAADANVFAQPPVANAPDLKPALDSADTGAATAQPSLPQPAIAAASPPTPASNSSSMPTLMAALACALGLAFILGGIAIKFFGQPRDNDSRVDDRAQRRQIWSDIADDEIPQSYPAIPTPANLDELARAARDSDNPDRDIEQLLGKASRRRAA